MPGVHHDIAFVVNFNVVLGTRRERLWRNHQQEFITVVTALTRTHRPARVDLGWNSIDGCAGGLHLGGEIESKDAA